MLPTYTVPSYLTPVHQLLSGARVQATADTPEAKDGTPKTNRAFPGCNAWKIEVSLIMRERAGDDGVVEREIKRSRVTVWTPERPNIAPDDVVTFQGLMAGAVDGNIFLQATGVERAEESSDELL